MRCSDDSNIWQTFWFYEDKKKTQGGQCVLHPDDLKLWTKSYLHSGHGMYLTLLEFLKAEILSPTTYLLLYFPRAQKVDSAAANITDSPNKGCRKHQVIVCCAPTLGCIDISVERRFCLATLASKQEQNTLQKANQTLAKWGALCLLTAVAGRVKRPLSFLFEKSSLCLSFKSFWLREKQNIFVFLFTIFPSFFCEISHIAADTQTVTGAFCQDSFITTITMDIKRKHFPKSKCQQTKVRIILFKYGGRWR